MFSFIIYILIAALGFIMAFVFRQTNTTASVLKPDPKKLMKLFFLVFSVATIVTFTLSWFTTYELGTSNITDVSQMKFNDMKSIMWFVMNLSFFIMIVLANTYSLSLKKVALLPYFLAIVFYAGFVLKDSYIISNYLELWQHSVKLLKGTLPDFRSHNTAWVKCGLGSIVTLFNVGMIWWGLRK
jgi:hypothetical protein